MFYVAYTTGDPHRPVTFLYNGGPGSSTLWLHMGSLGPVRVLTDSPRPTHNAPYDLANNNDSLLDKSDLVFLDAVGRRLLAPARRHQAGGLLGHRPGHRRLRPRHRALADDQRPLERAEVPVRRELRHHPLGRPLLSPAAGRGAAERRRPALLDPQLRPPPARLRPGDDQLPAELRRRSRPITTGWPISRRTSPPSSTRCATSRAAPTPWRWPRARTCGDAERRAIAAEAVRLHRPAGRLHPGQRPAHPARPTSARSCCATSA